MAGEQLKASPPDLIEPPEPANGPEAVQGAIDRALELPAVEQADRSAGNPVADINEANVITLPPELDPNPIGYKPTDAEIEAEIGKHIEDDPIAASPAQARLQAEGRLIRRANNPEGAAASEAQSADFVKQVAAAAGENIVDPQAPLAPVTSISEAPGFTEQAAGAVNRAVELPPPPPGTRVPEAKPGINFRDGPVPHETGRGKFEVPMPADPSRVPGFDGMVIRPGFTREKKPGETEQ
jgi:hypothetical protein